MGTRARTRGVRWQAVAAAVAALATTIASVGLSGPAYAGGKGHDKRGEPVTVMTRNLYLGADINRPVNAALAAQAAGGSPQDVLVALANATHQTREIVDRTNFPVRAGLIAQEIARTRPDLVGLQEVALWRSGPLDLTQVGVPNATTVDYDYLQLLLDALAARGQHYVGRIAAARPYISFPGQVVPTR